MSALNQNTIDRQMMARAIRLAENGLFTCSPNPRVGCVITKHGKILAEGWHAKAGEQHAEIHAMSQLLPEQLEGSTVYVSLEPCAHIGRTGPCAQALIDAKVSRVVCAMQDPAPHVAGQGIVLLENAGISVISGLLDAEAKALNPGFLKRMEKQSPYVRVKLAASIDGRTALNNGASKWITGEYARADVHYWRARSDAIVTGSATVLADNPQMTARFETGKVKQPQRFVIDSGNKVRRDAKIFEGEGAIVVGIDETADWQLPKNEKAKVDLKIFLEKLVEQEVNEVWVEAGAELAGAFVEADLVDELIIYMAPVLLGDKAKPLLVLDELISMQNKKGLKLIDQRMFGEDLRLRYTFN